MLDRYWNGAVSRISPEAPVPVVRVDSDNIRVGGAGNVAFNASMLGVQTFLLGLVGDDDASKELKHLLDLKNIHCQLQYVQNSRTITKLRVVSKNQQLIRLDFEDDFPKWDENALLSSVTAHLPGCDVVVLSDYEKGTLRSCSSIIDEAIAREKPILVDPKGRDFTRYKRATLLTPNLAEFEAVVGHCDSESDIEQRAAALCNELMLDAILITRSEKGMTLSVQGQPPLHLPARAKEVYDVTGAGDTVIATLASAIASGSSLHDAALFANAAAGVVVGKLGTSTVTLQELKCQLQSASGDVRSGILDHAELELQISLARSNGDRIVMTNGCFDILHPGHIDFLEKAKLLGDKLIVAVNDDSSVKRLKGITRPVNKLEDRIRMLCSLSSVDWVIPFSEDTPETLYAKYLPDVLVKGGDYAKSQIAGASIVEDSGGEVHIIDFLPGYSTSSLINRILGDS